MLLDRGETSGFVAEEIADLERLSARDATSREVEAAALRVSQYGFRRRWAAELGEALDEARGDMGDLVETVTKRLGRLQAVASQAQTRSDRPIGEHVPAVLRAANEAYDRRKKKMPMELSTGFATLDLETAGLHRRELTLVTGITGKGKSAFAGCLAANVALNGRGVLVYQIEDTSETYTRRAACAIGRTHARRLRDGDLSPDEYANFVSTCDTLRELPLRIDESEKISPVDIEGRARRAQMRFEAEGKRLGLIVVDYLQLLDRRGVVSDFKKQNEAVGEIAKALLSIAQRLDVAVVALSQLNNQGMIADSSGPLRHAQSHWKIKRSKKTSRNGDEQPYTPREAEPVLLCIEKQRHGPSPVNVPMWFHGDYVLFSDEERPR